MNNQRPVPLSASNGKTIKCLPFCGDKNAGNHCSKSSHAYKKWSLDPFEDSSNFSTSSFKVTRANHAPTVVVETPRREFRVLEDITCISHSVIDSESMREKNQECDCIETCISIKIIDSVIVVANATCLTVSDRGPGNSSWQRSRCTPVVIRSFENHSGGSTF
ncbi:hypothetical protein TNCV_2354111 [Trichonephila clavipes]|nr:hypothetical protein TNCV_2354111 [Trichonephila clavipes]